MKNILLQGNINNISYMLNSVNANSSVTEFINLKFITLSLVLSLKSRSFFAKRLLFSGFSKTNSLA